MKVIQQAGVVAVKTFPQSNDGIRFGFVEGSNGLKPLVLPKGHLEEGETLQGAALREAAEELGVAGYLFGTPFVQTLKLKDEDFAREVTYFPMQVTNDIGGSPEGRTVAWLTLGTAEKNVVFPELLGMVRQVRRLV